jgi:hypothetical protein
VSGWARMGEGPGGGEHVPIDGEAHAAQSERADFDGRGWGEQPVAVEGALGFRGGGWRHFARKLGTTLAIQLRRDVDDVQYLPLMAFLLYLKGALKRGRPSYVHYKGVIGPT